MKIPKKVEVKIADDVQRQVLALIQEQALKWYTGAVHHRGGRWNYRVQVTALEATMDLTIEWDERK